VLLFDILKKQRQNECSVRLNANKKLTAQMPFYLYILH